MIPAPFDYVRADSVEHAVTQLAEANGDGEGDGDVEGKIIASGQRLMPLLALRLAQASVLIDINRVPGLAEIIPLPRRRAATGGKTSAPACRATSAAAPVTPASESAVLQAATQA